MGISLGKPVQQQGIDEVKKPLDCGRLLLAVIHYFTRLHRVPRVYAVKSHPQAAPRKIRIPSYPVREPVQDRIGVRSVLGFNFYIPYRFEALAPADSLQGFFDNFYRSRVLVFQVINL